MNISLLAAVGESGGSSDLVDLVLFAVVGFILAEYHRGLAGGLGVVVPDGLGIIHRVLLLAGVHLFLLLPLSALGVPEDDAALVVVVAEPCIDGEVPLESLALLNALFSLPCQPNDHCDCVPIGLFTFFGLGISIELFPAGVSSIIFVVKIITRIRAFSTRTMNGEVSSLNRPLYNRQVSLTDHFPSRAFCWGCHRRFRILLPFPAVFFAYPSVADSSC